MGSSPSPVRPEHPAARLEPQDPYLRLQSVRIVARDSGRSVPFYVDQLGFNLIFDARTWPRRRWLRASTVMRSTTVTNPGVLTLELLQIKLSWRQRLSSPRDGVAPVAKVIVISSHVT